MRYWQVFGGLMLVASLFISAGIIPAEAKKKATSKGPEQSVQPTAVAAPKPNVMRIGGYNPAEQIKPVSFINPKGEIVLPDRLYKSIGNFSQGLACVLAIPDTEVTMEAPPPKYGYINRAGQWAIAPQFDMAGDFKPVDMIKTPNKSSQSAVLKLARIKRNNAWGYIDDLGKIVIQPQYDWAGDFSGVLAPVHVKSGFGFIDATGKMVVKADLEDAEPFSDGLARVWDGRTNHRSLPVYKFINSKGEVVFETTYDWVTNFQNGLAQVGNRADEDLEASTGKLPNPRLYGYIDKTGKLVVPIQFESAWPLSKDGLALVKSKGKFGYINATGQWIIPPQFDWADEFKEGRAAVGQDTETGRQFGFIDVKGDKIIQPHYSWVAGFSEGLAPAAQVELTALGDPIQKYGFINKTGTWAIPPKFRWVKPFSGGLAQVELLK